MLLSSRLRAAQVALSILLLSLTTVQATFVPRGNVCNGQPEFCDLSYGNITFVGAHDSYAVGTNNLAANQDYNVTQQLDDGVRLLQMQAHNNSGVIQLCHTSCSLYNGGTLQTYLQTVKTWLDANPNEVLTLLIVNSDNYPPTAYDAVFKSVGLDTISYIPPSSALPATGWPTLGSMIQSGQRLVTFMDANANFASVPYIIDEFTNVWETPFDVTTEFDCSVNRTKGDASKQMFLINHFFDVVVLGQPAPDVSLANVTNSVDGPGSLGAQVDLCVADYGRNPNFMLVDFYEYGGGSVFEVAASANGVTYNPTTPIATPIPTTSVAASTSAAPSMFKFRSEQTASLLFVIVSMIFGAWRLV